MGAILIRGETKLKFTIKHLLLILKRLEIYKIGGRGTIAPMPLW